METSYFTSLTYFCMMHHLSFDSDTIFGISFVPVYTCVHAYACKIYVTAVLATYCIHSCALPLF